MRLDRVAEIGSTRRHWVSRSASGVAGCVPAVASRPRPSLACLVLFGVVAVDGDRGDD
jgi:hypothetical protein